MMPSTTYAVARVFIEAGETDTLMRMMDDRLNYGLFPDTPTFAMILNHFLVKENWYYLTHSLADCWKFGAISNSITRIRRRDAAKTAISMALQEEGSVADHPIAAEMALYGVYKYAMLSEQTEAWEPWKPAG